MKKYILKKQLKEEVMDDRELAELLSVIDKLKATELPTLSNKTKLKIEAIAGEPSKLPRVALWSVAGSFAVFLVLVLSAQYATPGSPLYGIKQGTEYIRALFQPSYKETIIENERKELEKIEGQTMPALETELTEQQKKNEPDSRRGTRNENRNNRQNDNDSRNDSWRYENFRNNNRSDSTRSDSRYDNNRYDRNR